MKRILFLRTTTTETKKMQLAKSLEKFLGDDVTAEAASLSELAFLANGKASRIWHVEKGWDVADFDLVVFSRVGDEIEKVTSIAYYLQSKNVAFVDRYALRPGKGKLAGAFLRTAHGLPVPTTFFGSAAAYAAVFAGDAPISFPLILKADNGRKGRDNYLIRDYDELLEILEKTAHLAMIAQEFIPNDGDMRVLVLNGKVRLVILRKGKEGSHLNNTSQGGNATLLPISELDKRIETDCKLAAKLEELQVAGVDIVVSKETGKHYILEVNRAPQIYTGAFTDEKLQAYASMLPELTASDMSKRPMTTIGRAEQVTLHGLGVTIPARIDTGAKTSALWASAIRVDDAGILHFVLFDDSSEYFTGEEITTADFSETVVSNSTGNAEKRYRVKLHISLRGRKIHATFTLANRATQVYPVLIGRNVLRGKFVVDVKMGTPLYKAEQVRTQELQADLRHAEAEKGEQK